MSESLDQFAELDVRLFAESLDEMSAAANVADLVCEEMRDDMRKTAFIIGRRALDLGLMRHVQFHSVPLSESRYRALANFEFNREGKAAWLRVTTNKQAEIESSLYRVESQDFRLGLLGKGAGTIAMRQSVQKLHGIPNNQLGDSLPILWESRGGTMRRYAGPQYSLVPPSSLKELGFEHLTRQYSSARQLSETIRQLNREVTLEAEHPYLS